jgi:predicted Zn-dependent protease
MSHSSTSPRNVHAIRFIALCLLAVATGAGCMASDKTVIQQASQFNDGIKPAVIEQPQNMDYMQQIGARIIAAAKECDAEHIGPKSHFSDKDRDWMYQDIHWQLVNSKTLNAFTTGGHYVYIYNQLFQMCKNEDELAAVMAHEYGHIYSRHVQKGTGRQEALAAVALAAGGAGYVAGGEANGAQYSQYASSAAQSGGSFVNMGFSRQDEAQADQYGFYFYCRAGWPPQHFADFFKAMIAAGYDKLPAIESDHPTLASRVTATEARVKKLDPADVAQWAQPNIATQEQFDEFKQAALAASKGMPDDQKVLQAKNLLQALPRSCWVPYDPDDERQAQELLFDQAKPKQQGQ